METDVQKLMCGDIPFRTIYRKLTYLLKKMLCKLNSFIVRVTVIDINGWSADTRPKSDSVSSRNSDEICKYVLRMAANTFMRVLLRSILGLPYHPTGTVEGFKRSQLVS
jgi:hypothetical protein